MTKKYVEPKGYITPEMKKILDAGKKTTGKTTEKTSKTKKKNWI